MSFSMIVVTTIILLLLFGAGQRVLDQMRMNDTWALVLMLGIVVGLIIPPISIGPYFSFSIGGFLIPFGICIYLIIMCGWSKDLLRVLIGTLVTAGGILALNYLLPSETPQDIVIDTSLLYGLIAGTIAYALGRSRRNAFISAILGVFVSSVAIFLINLWGYGLLQKLTLGVGGAFDMVIISALIAVGLAELIGRVVESSVKKENKQFNFNTGEYSEIETPTNDTTTVIEKSKQKTIKK